MAGDNDGDWVIDNPDDWVVSLPDSGVSPAPELTADPSGGMFSAPEATAASQTPFIQRATDLNKGIAEGGILAADAATYGMGNRAIAWGRGVASQEGYDKYIEQQNAYLNRLRAENPERAIAAELTGGFLGGSGLARAGITLARPGVGWVSRAIRGTAEGAAHGAAQSAGQNYGDWGDKVSAGAQGAVLGGVLGGGVPIGVSAAAGARNLHRAMRGNRPEFPPSLLRAVDADRQGVQNLTTQYGPDAMLPDAGPSMRGLAQGAATAPGEGRSALDAALRARDRQTGRRIEAGAEDILGPDVVPSEVRGRIQAVQRELSPAYDEVFEGSGVRAIDTTALAQSLDAQIPNLRGEAQTALSRVRRMLNITGTRELDVYPRTLQATRQAVDGILESPNLQRNTRRVLTDARNRMTEELHAKVPGIDTVDAQYHALANQRRAFDMGEGIFKTEQENVIRPSELRALHANTAQPQGNQIGPPTAGADRIRSRQGTRAEIGRQIGTGTNNLRKLQGVFDDGNWATQKLAEQFGVQNADDFIRLLETNQHFRESYQKIVHGAKTAETLAAADDIAGGASIPTSATGAAIEMANRALNRVRAGNSTATRNDIARIMATQGADLPPLQRRLLAAGDEQARRDVARMIIENAIRRSTSGAIPSLQGR